MELTLADLQTAEQELVRMSLQGADPEWRLMWARHTQSIYDGLSDEARAKHAASTAV
jgi:hypothetical protein